MDTDTTTTDQSNREVVPPRLHLRPVRPMESGIGLPYAPENWPKPGDTWRWKVGPRITGKGTFLDRYLYPPKHLPGLSNTETLRKGTAFRSRLSLERYIRLAFPDADVRKFFASFSWAVPSTDGQIQVIYSLCMKRSILPVYTSDEDPMHDNVSDIMVCKAGNDKCGSLMMPPPSETEPMTCDICCSEPSFCTDCSCILCCKSVSVEHEGYSYTKCEAVVSEGRICGHVAHINCALRAYMAGTVGGSIGLDAEYYCRRCDARKDLVPHVNRFLEICKTVEYQGDVEKILNLGICVLRGSQRVDAKELLNCIESTVIKLKCGTSLEDLWNDDTPTIWSDFSESEGKDNDDAVQSLQDVTPIEPMPFNREAEMHKLEEEIREVLKALREAQESEYQIAEVRLHAQKECLGDLYRQLEEEKSELSRRVSGSDAESLMTNVLKRLDQIRKEVTKLKEMEEVAKGFGRTPRGILEEYFHLAIEE
uniref:Uncharacterized protein n=1 Tax=Brassica oleracea TaxID=3712 RepID=A0A3P6EVS7_BRAOL|nr:unnamed protein product [Brassica oleracea]